MKKAVAVLVAVLFLVSLAACGTASRALSFDEFIEKYKRADFDAFLDDPRDFMEDYLRVPGVRDYAYGDDASSISLDGWTEVRTITGDDASSTSYTLDGVLFNRPVVFSCTYMQVFIDSEPDRMFWSFAFDGSDASELFSAAQSLFYRFSDMYGDPVEITGIYPADPISEHDLLECFASGTVLSFRASFDSPSGSPSLSFSDYGRLSIY